MNTVFRATAIVGLAAMITIGGCSSSDRSEEHLGTTRQAITTIQTDFPIAFTPDMETDVAYVTSGGTDRAKGHWIGVANNNQSACNGSGPRCSNIFSWMYSTDGQGNSWILKNQTTGTDFGCPGPGGACPGTVSPATGWPFYG